MASAVLSARSLAANHAANFAPTRAPVPVSQKIVRNGLRVVNRETALMLDHARSVAVFRKTGPAIEAPNLHGPANLKAGRAPLASIAKQHQAVPRPLPTGSNDQIVARLAAPSASFVRKQQDRAPLSALAGNAPIPRKFRPLKSGSKFARQKKASRASQPAHQTVRTAVPSQSAPDRAPDKVEVLQLPERNGGLRSLIVIDRDALSSVRALAAIGSSVPALIAPRPLEHSDAKVKIKTVQSAPTADRHPARGPVPSVVPPLVEASLLA